VLTSLKFVESRKYFLSYVTHPRLAVVSLSLPIQGDQKVSVLLMITIQNYK